MIYIAVAVLFFVVGKEYGAAVQKEAVSVSLAALTKAKTVFARVVTNAQAEAAAEAARLEARAKKYL